MVNRPPAFLHSETGTAEQQWVDDARWAAVPALTPFDDGRIERVVVVAAHPDDETLGAGGLITAASAAGLRVDVVVFTDGEASHPHSPSMTQQQLAVLRRRETRSAVRRLSPSSTVIFANLGDGRLSESLPEAVSTLVDVIGEDGRATLLVAPWRGDRHPDHEAAGRAAAIAAERTDARRLEYPIWLWHWAAPGQAPWGTMRVLALDDLAFTAKQEALAQHGSQVRALSEAAGDEVLLTTDMLAHFHRDREVFVQPDLEDEVEVVDTAFDDLHQERSDPWTVESSWFEQRKRRLTLAALPAEHYGRVLEIGCSVGLLAHDLSTRCDDLVALDRSHVAVERARHRLRDVPHARVDVAVVPRDWPTGTFDLVVVSEIGYFLSPLELEGLLARVRDSLEPHGHVVLCHWRHPIVGWPLDGDRVHDLWSAASEQDPLVVHRERDFLLEVHAHPGAHPPVSEGEVR
ncbi:MAG: PIG-L family deacetylase [Terracoccus sp.]